MSTAPVTIGDLFPELTEEQQREAAENLDRYMAVVLRIYERIRHDPEAYQRFRTLTDSERYATMQGTDGIPS
jgi:hypothetical protein